MVGFCTCSKSNMTFVCGWRLTPSCLGRGTWDDWNPMGNGGEAEPVPNTALPSPEWFCLKTVEGKRTGMAATALHDRGEEDWILQYIPWACPLLNHLCDDQMWPEGTTLQKNWKATAANQCSAYKPMASASFALWDNCWPLMEGKVTRQCYAWSSGWLPMLWRVIRTSLECVQACQSPLAPYQRVQKYGDWCLQVFKYADWCLFIAGVKVCQLLRTWYQSVYKVCQLFAYFWAHCPGTGWRLPWLFRYVYINI